MVDFILRHGNDLLAVEVLKGFEVRLHLLNASFPSMCSSC